ncbi:MAG: PilZ domain-containing protein [Deltaproteobacteria bacterium]|nr:PilZ domain-containing protein [Deltaproteobacteria bacterium]
MAANRRTNSRFDVWIEAKLTVNGNLIDCTVTNLSLGGALVGGTKQSMGQRLQIAFRVPTIDEAIEVGAIVRWSDAKGVGMQFDGLRARDVWALNEYFKQLV